MRRYKRILLVFLAAAVFFLRYIFALPSLDSSYVGSYVGESMTVVGEVVSDTDERTAFTQFYVRTKTFERFGNTYALNGEIIVRVQIGFQLEYGDLVELSGQIEQPTRKDPRIAGYMNNPNVKSIGSRDNSFFRHVLKSLYRFKKILIQRLNNLFPVPASSLAAGVLLGVRTSVPPEVTDDFKKTGLTHILALSGYNIVILIEFMSLLFGFLPRKYADIATILTIVIFTIFVGAAASIVRASVMGSLGIFARFFGRKTAGIRTLLLTGYAMALIDPFIVMHDIGFQLSFGATAGIMLFTKKLEKVFQKIPERFQIRASLATTWAAQVFTTPLIIFYFKGFSLVSSVANITVLPIVPFLMLGSFLSLLFGKIVAAPTFLLFKIFTGIIHFFASLPFAFMDAGIS